MAHTLIDKALEKCGTRYKLAGLTHLSEAYLSNVYSGKRELSPLAAAKIASIAGLDAKEAMAVTAIENEKDPDEREALKRVFFRSGAVAMLVFSIIGLPLAPSPAMAETASECAALYIMLNLTAMLCVCQTWCALVRTTPTRLQTVFENRFSVPRGSLFVER